MKYKYLVLSMSILLLSCTAHTSNVSNTTKIKYDYITAEAADHAIRNCRPEQTWTMRSGGVSVMVVQANNCLEIDKILFIATPSDQYTNEIRTHSVKLIGLHFLEHLKRTTSNQIWSLEQIHEFNYTANNENEAPVWLVLYKINSKSVTCTGSTCNKNETPPVNHNP